ncbi:MAG: precorrin-6A reductase [Peptoniphilus sp.]|nr:precorrin-6A reductase [Peptoniphilus sp.]MDD7363723.1 precorrin-6A reductase [Bacillota bacterium]MDY6044108.1 precorrin-6A reductase [Peptoniphilus sp.]
MKIWIIGGTSESARLVREVDRRQLAVTVVSDEAREFLPEDLEVRVGRMSKEEMVRFIEDEAVAAVVDMSHPFAKIVSEEAKEAARSASVPYYRYARDIEERAGDHIFSNYASCAEFIGRHTGTFFFTTGSKHCDLFESVRGESRHIYRIIPSEKSVRALRAAGVEMKDIIAMLGPFDDEMNKALFLHAGADYLVTKNSGAGSGFRDKIRAAADLHMKSLVIATEAEEGYGYDDIKRLVERISNEILLSLLHE